MTAALEGRTLNGFNLARNVDRFDARLEEGKRTDLTQLGAWKKPHNG
jgi:hypothetical protein